MSPFGRELRKRLVEAVSKALSPLEAWIPRAMLGWTLFSIHFTTFTVSILGVGLWGGKRAIETLFAAIFFVLVLFFLLDGCILTAIEHHYTEQKTTVIDIFLKMVDIPVTSDTRKTTTVIGFLLILAGFLVIYLREYVLHDRCFI